MIDRISTLFPFAGLSICLLAAILLVAGCGPRQDPRTRKAGQVLADVSAQDPQFTVYALEVAARASSQVAVP